MVNEKPIFGEGNHKVQRRSIDVYYAVKPGDTTPPKALFARPIRITPDDHLGVLVDQRVFPVYENEDGQHLVFSNLESFETLNCSLPVSGKEYRVKSTGIPRESPEIVNFSVNSSNFGTHVLLRCSDIFVEALVEKLVNHKGLKVVAWDSIDDHKDFDWRIDLPSGLNLSRIRDRIVDIAEEVSKEISENIRYADLEKLQQSIEKLATENIEKEVKNKSDLERVTNELNLAYAEISKLADEVAQSELHSSSVSAKSLRKTRAEKLVASLLKSLYSNLAFSPDSPRLVLEKFVNSHGLWRELAKLNSSDLQGQHRLVNLHGPAGKSGWAELQAHISSGADSRGRIYARKSKNSHFYDIVLHWKKNESEQARMFRRIANFRPFISINVIEGEL